jgi:hypothetical protein
MGPWGSISVRAPPAGGAASVGDCCRTGRDGERDRKGREVRGRRGREREREGGRLRGDGEAGEEERRCRHAVPACAHLRVGRKRSGERMGRCWWKSREWKGVDKISYMSNVEVCGVNLDCWFLDRTDRRILGDVDGLGGQPRVPVNWTLDPSSVNLAAACSNCFYPLCLN